MVRRLQDTAEATTSTVSVQSESGDGVCFSIVVDVVALQLAPDDDEHVLGKVAAGVGTAKPSITGPALDRLCGHAFPGNVRELENILERAMTLAEGDVIGLEDLQLTGESSQSPFPEEEAARPPDMPLEDYLC